MLTLKRKESKSLKKLEELQKEVAELKEIIIPGNVNQRAALQREMPRLQEMALAA
uniref:Uncharacterized protein n=1 Tax=Romanomermis culicivorax TaxID=13658 RepID=A0A915KE11_ROMCU